MKKVFILLFVAMVVIILFERFNCNFSEIQIDDSKNQSVPIQSMLPNGTSRGNTKEALPHKSTTIDQMNLPNDVVKDIVAFLYDEADSNLDILEFETDLRTSLAAGWTPPWQHLAPAITPEQAKSMSTPELAKACFSSGVFTRTLLIYDDPRVSFSRLKILYPCYAELFERKDLFEGVLNIYSSNADFMKPDGDSYSVIDGLMGFENLPKVFYLLKMKEQIKGNEILLIHKQLESLKSIRKYIEGDDNSSSISSTPYFSATTPVVLVNITLEFMKRVSESHSTKAIDAISRLQLSQKYTMGQVKHYMDVAIAEIELFLNTYEK